MKLKTEVWEKPVVEVWFELSTPARCEVYNDIWIHSISKLQRILRDELEFVQNFIYG